MSTPFHYDLDALTKLCRATASDAIAAARGAADGKVSQLGVDAQERLIPAIEFLIVGQADLANRGIPPGLVMQALGAIMGSAAVSAAKSTGSPVTALEDLMRCFSDAVVGLMSGKTPDTATQRVARFSATPGGRA